MLHQGMRNDLHHIRNSTERQTLYARYAPRFSLQRNANRHLRRSTSQQQTRIENHILRNRHHIRQVPIDLVGDVFCRPAEEDRACFWGFAFSEVRKVKYSSPILSM